MLEKELLSRSSQIKIVFLAAVVANFFIYFGLNICANRHALLLACPWENGSEK
tara:strand:- start:1276 stop:1434 length:159 start_codon:yes stop_codon:yes gene_type:complete